MPDNDITSDVVDFAKSILDHNQDLINFVDTKAGVILVADGAILALFTGSALVTDTSMEQIIFAIAVVLVGISAVFGFLTISPRFIPGTPSTRIFFDSITMKKRDDYVKSFASPLKDILEDYLNNIYTLALIQKRKYYFLKSSLNCLLFGLIPIVVLIILQRT